MITYHVGDTREVIATIPDGSVDLVATSPPFYQLRSYVPSDHDAKSFEIGSEPDPATFLDTLLALTAEWGRVLAPHGSIAVELGDTYSGSGGAGGDYNEGGLRDGQDKFLGSARAQRQTDTLKARPKSLACIPDLYTIALAYGIHPLTGKESPAGKWLVRNKIVWHRPNPAVGALGDKVRPSTSYIVIATRSPKRWFDLSAVRSGAPLRTADTAVPSVPDAQEVATTFGTGTGDAARGWCEPGRSEISLDTTVAWHTKRLQVVEPIGFLVGVEQGERAQMMDLQSIDCPADLTLVAVTAQRILSGDWPVSSSVVGAPALEAGMVIASDIDGPPLSGTLKSAEVVSQRLASVSGHWLAAEITLKVNGAHATAYAIAPIGRSVSHTNQFTSNHADQARHPRDGSPNQRKRDGGGDYRDESIRFGERVNSNPAGAPPLDAWSDHYDGTHDTWTLTTQPSRLAHYAMWPAKLAERLILSMCPREVCRVCGEPRRRMECAICRVCGEPRRRMECATNLFEGRFTASRERERDHRPRDGAATGAPSYKQDRETLGWTDCGHDDYRPGLVLDPFAGSGTTLAVADLHGRDAIGIDFDARNKAIYPARYDEVKKALYGTPAPMPGQETFDFAI